MVGKSDIAFRAEKEAMLRRVIDIRKRYARLDSLEWSLANDEAAMLAALKKYKADLRGPLLRFFAGAQMEKVALRAHNEFLRAVAQYINPRNLRLQKEVSARLLESLRESVVRNIDGLLAGFDPLFTERLKQIKAYAAANEQAALLSQIGTADVKIQSLARSTWGDDIGKAWEKMRAKYGSRETVRYRDGKNYPLNTYLDGRANTTSADVHRLTTQYDAAQSGIYTGKISNHGASDSCRPWEGKIVCFSAESRDQLSKVYPQARNLKTVDEIRADKSTHMWKFNCRHIVTPYPIQFFDRGDAEQELAA